MSTQSSDSSDQSPSETQNTEAEREAALESVKNERGRGRLELVIAIILSVTTLTSTWCTYQARLWGGVQSGKESAADIADRQSAEDTIVGLQLRSFDAMQMNEYWAALRRQDNDTRDAIFPRMRPQLRKAIEASLAAGVLNNPDVPGPLQRPEYTLTAEQDAARLKAEAAEWHAVAELAGEKSDSYVLLTVMFASVLFFGGITGTFSARRVRLALAGVALTIFLVTFAMFVQLPVCRSGSPLAGKILPARTATTPK